MPVARPPRIPPLATVAAVAVLALAGCGDDEEAADTGGGGSTTGEGTSAPAGPGAVEVSLGEWFVKPATASVGAGETSFEAKNDGEVVHELEVVKTDLAADKLPVRNQVADVEEAGEEIAEVEDIAAGKSAPLEARLEPGKYVLICNIPTHYELGMRSGLTVR